MPKGHFKVFVRPIKNRAKGWEYIGSRYRPDDATRLGQDECGRGNYEYKVEAAEPNPLPEETQKELARLDRKIARKKKKQAKGNDGKV